MTDQLAGRPGTGAHGIDDDLVDRAVARAARWGAATGGSGGSRGERVGAERLAALVHDPDGVAFTMRFVDQVARPDDAGVAARALSRLAAPGAAVPAFLTGADRFLLRAGAVLAPRAPRLVVPLAKRRLRGLVGHLVVDAGGPSLRRRTAAARRHGFRLNLNLLGEAVLGEDEADRRVERTRALLRRRDVDHVSVKASSVASQLVPWDLEGSRDRLVARLAPLMAEAAAAGTFVNLDMEEYEDLDLTVAVFTDLLSRPELSRAEAGIVLQAYLPDSLAAFDELVAFGMRRRAVGGPPIKVRLVKGANLAMERVDAEVHDWPQAPFATKAEVDAHYVRLVERALRPEHAGAVRVGVASHNLHHVALAVELAAARGVADQLDVEMLQGMAPMQARTVRDDLRREFGPGDRLVLYTPVVHAQDFDAAVSYLVRRLEENAAPENYLYALVDHERGVAGQEPRFRASVRDRDVPPTTPRRTQDRRLESRPVPGPGFVNEPDTDPARPGNREWARAALAATPPPVRGPELTDPAAVDVVVARALEASAPWAARPASERAAVLRSAGAALASARGELLTVMAHEAGKTVAEADPEISEAVDFATYYADRAADRGADLGDSFEPDRVVVVTPPWNFPVAIPLGGCLAALAAGAAVVVAPAPQVRACAEVGVAALHAGGVPPEVLQLVHTDEGDAGRRLVTHSSVDTVVLTGATDTARLFRSWRPDLHLVAETSGKNALVVTPAADPDLAVADLVRSAFGHAGQKCSAASLAILVGSVGDGRRGVGLRWRRQLADAVRTLRVGPGTDPATTMGPLQEPASGKLRRALTTLEPGESWLVEPRPLSTDGRLWSPGVRDGVAAGSWFHRTECFGPVLGLMRASSLDEALAIQNGVGYGLTGGLHSLDPDEIDHWTERVEVGNAYVNRHITGAVVQRQSFGGWKDSVVGPGAKPGGPNYVAQFGRWHDGDVDELPVAPVGREAAAVLEAAAPALGVADLGWLRAAAASDAAAWRDEFSVQHDPTGLRAEANVFRYRPLPHLDVVAGADAAPRDVLRVVLAAAGAGVPVDVWGALDVPGVRVRSGRPELRSGTRLRLLGSLPEGLLAAAAEAGVSVLGAAPVASGRREMLTVLREQAISRTRHRFGHVDG